MLDYVFDDKATQLELIIATGHLIVQKHVVIYPLPTWKYSNI